MADTSGLAETRGEWADAVAEGSTNLPHRDWYEQKKKKKTMQANGDKGDKKEQPTLASLAFE